MSAGRRSARLHAIRQVLTHEDISSQTQLSDRLESWGYSVTQATLSRDLLQMGAFKVRRDGQAVYALAEQQEPQEPSSLVKMMQQLLLSAQGSSNTVVLRTPPGAANLLAVAIDNASDSAVLGTIAGDDTVLVISRDADGGFTLAQKFLQIAQDAGERKHN